MNHRLARVSFGVVLILHGLGHAVLPLRGAGSGPDGFVNALSILIYTTAIVGFVAAGLGMLGARPFRAWRATPAAAAALASVAALWLTRDPDLWPGIVLDLVLVLGTFGLARRPALSGVEGPPAAVTHDRFRAARDAAAMTFFAYVVVATVSLPWHRAWGVSQEERVASLPGDRTPRTPQLELMHGVTIEAPPEAVWPWLVQIGQDRAGFYSYDWLERLFLADIHNVDEIRPEWQQRAAGDFVRATQPGYLGGIFGQDLGWYVLESQPPRALVLHYWGAFVLKPDGTGGTRLLVRSTVSSQSIPVWAAAISFTAFELPHFVMERRMLLGIKERAERGRV